MEVLGLAGPLPTIQVRLRKFSHQIHLDTGSGGCPGPLCRLHFL